MIVHYDIQMTLDIDVGTTWGPCLIAKLVNITTRTVGFMVVITNFRWGYKSTYNWGAAH